MTNTQRDKYRLLKEVLFNQTKKEAERYWRMAKTDAESDETEMQRNRFVAVYKVICESGLQKEFAAWRKGR